MSTKLIPRVYNMDIDYFTSSIEISAIEKHTENTSLHIEIWISREPFGPCLKLKIIILIRKLHSENDYFFRFV